MSLETKLPVSLQNTNKCCLPSPDMDSYPAAPLATDSATMYESVKVSILRSSAPNFSTFFLVNDAPWILSLVQRGSRLSLLFFMIVFYLYLFIYYYLCRFYWPIEISVKYQESISTWLWYHHFHKKSPDHCCRMHQR